MNEYQPHPHAFILEEKRGLFWRLWIFFWCWVIDNFKMRRMGFEWNISKEYEELRTLNDECD